MLRSVLLMGIFWSLTPGVSFAAVTITEVAWMGDAVSASNEWIELHNGSASSVVVDGWTLGDGVNLHVDLAGTIPADSYVVLERTDDDSASGAAFLIYTGALGNTGATLTLKDSSGSVQQQVVGGEAWADIGGDNTTKETPQYTTSGWITTVSTPGEANEVIDTQPVVQVVTTSVADAVETEVTSSGSAASASRSVEAIKLELKDLTLDLDVSLPQVVYVNQVISFQVEPDGLGKTIMDSLSYEWNFGDATTKKGKNVAHTYAYPGEYVVSVYATYARHEQSARHTVTVLPVTFSITRNKNGDIQIHNDAPYEVDLSGYTLQGSEMFVFPRNTFILSGATITIPAHRMQTDQYGTLVMRDQAAAVVARSASIVTPSPAAVPLLVSQQQPTLLQSDVSYPVSSSHSDADEVPNFSFASAPVTQKKTDVVNLSPGDQEVIQKVSPTPTSKPNSQNSFPFIGLIGVITVALFGLYSKKVHK